MSLTALKVTVCSVTLVGLAVLGGSRLPSPAVADGTNSGGIVLEATMPRIPAAFEMQLALAGEREGGARTAPRDGEQPRTGARDGEVPRTGPRDGDVPRTGPRDGDAPRVGIQEGERPRGFAGAMTKGERNPLANFQPQTQREAVLFQMIVQMQREMAELRQLMQARGIAVGEGGVMRGVEGGPGVGVRQGEGNRTNTGPREGDGAKSGPREGEKPRVGPREGDK